MKFSESFKQIFVGPPLKHRKHAPRIIEHVKLCVLNFLSFIILWTIILIITESKSDESLSQRIFDFVNDFYAKLLLAALLGFYLASVVISIRLLFMLKKTEVGKMYVLFSVIFTFLLFTNVFVIFSSSIAWRINDLVYK